MIVSKILEIWEIVEKIKTDVDKLLLVLTMKIFFSIYFAKIELFLNFETKRSLSTSVFIFSTISQILKRNCYVLQTQTCRNLRSIKLSNFSSITCPYCRGSSTQVPELTLRIPGGVPDDPTLLLF